MLRLLASFLLLLGGASLSAAAIPADVADVQPDSAIRAAVHDDQLTIEWPADAGRVGVAVFSLQPDAPLIESLALRSGPTAAPRELAHRLQPYFAVTVGQRDLSRNGWTVFFDKVNTRPTSRHLLRPALSPASAPARVRTHGSRATVEFDGLSGGGFAGKLVFQFFAGSPLVEVAALVATADPARAFVYDAGLHATDDSVQRYGWADPLGRFSTTPASVVAGVPRATKYRAIVAQTAGGSLAIFPPPHRFFYPLDFADNFAFNFAGRDYDVAAPGQSWGVCQPPDGDQRFLPWVNAPPGTTQRLSFFVLLSTGHAADALEAAKRYTHDDRYPPLAGHRVFASHFHVEHTMDVLDARAESGRDALPENLQAPGFVKALRDAGVDLVHLAEFHYGRTPKLDAAARLAQLQTLHAECARLSDDRFLLLPGEEPNVHFGGHWLSFFPRPVNWVLNRPAGTPFAQTMPDGQTLYHVGSADDVLELMKREHGLMWTAHPRIKTSIGFPDQYRDTPFFRSAQFLGAAWKAMPADYSRDRLGERVLDLFDDMENWGAHKQVLGEADVFRIEPESELYGHLNVNYLELDRLPRFADGWQPVLDALRGGRFFVTTGEVLLSDFSVNGARSGGRAAVPPAGELVLRAQLAWTFPLAFADIVTGNGTTTEHRRVELSGTSEFGTRAFETAIPAARAKWVRLEVWDIAGNGAFTQPVWIE